MTFETIYNGSPESDDRQDELTRSQLNSHLNYCSVIDVSQSLIEKNVSKLDETMWKKVSKKPDLTRRFLEKYKNDLDWNVLVANYRDLDYIVRYYPERIDWNVVSSKRKLTGSQIIRYKNKLEWDQASYSQDFDLATIKRVKRNLNWRRYSSGKYVKMDIIKKFKRKVNWEKLSYNYSSLNTETLWEFRDKLYWDVISNRKNLKKEHIVMFSHKIVWAVVENFNEVPERLIEKNWYKIDIIRMVSSKFLSEEFIRKHKDKICTASLLELQNLPEDMLEDIIENQKNDSVSALRYGHLISRNQKVSEAFINQHAQYINWKEICKQQSLGENFIRENRYFVDWDYISAYQKISKSFIEEFIDVLNINILMYNHLLDEDVVEYVRKVFNFKRKF